MEMNSSIYGYGYASPYQYHPSSLHWCFHCPSTTKWVSTTPMPPHPFQHPFYSPPPPPSNPTFAPLAQIDMISNSINTIQDTLTEMKEHNSRLISSFSQIRSLLHELQLESMALEDAKIEEATVEDAADNNCIDESALDLIDANIRPMAISELKTEGVEDYSWNHACNMFAEISTRNIAIEFEDSAKGDSVEIVTQVFDKMLQPLLAPKCGLEVPEYKVNEYTHHRRLLGSSNKLFEMAYHGPDFPFDPGTCSIAGLLLGYYALIQHQFFDTKPYRFHCSKFWDIVCAEDNIIYIDRYNGDSCFRKNVIHLVYNCMGNGIPQRTLLHLPFDPGESIFPPIQSKLSEIHLDKLLCLPISSFDVFNLVGPLEGGMLFDENPGRKIEVQTVKPLLSQPLQKPPFFALILHTSDHVLDPLRLQTRLEHCPDSIVEGCMIVPAHLAILVKIYNQGIVSKQTRLVVVINSVGGSLCTNACKQVHPLSVKLGFQCYNFFINNFVDSYEKCSRLDSVARTFYECPTLDMPSFTPHRITKTLGLSDSEACPCTCWINWSRFQPNVISASSQTFPSAFATEALGHSDQKISQSAPYDCVAEHIVQVRLLVVEHNIWNPSIHIAPVFEKLQLVLFIKLGVSIQNSVSRPWLLFHLVFLGKLKVPPDILFESLVVHLDVTQFFSIVIYCGECGRRSNSNLSTIPLVTRGATMLCLPINGLSLAGNKKRWKSIVQAIFLVLDTWATVINILEQLLEAYTCLRLAKEIVRCFVEMGCWEHLVVSSVRGKHFPPDAMVLTFGTLSANYLYAVKAIVIAGCSCSGNRFLGSLTQGSYALNKGQVLPCNLDTGKSLVIIGGLDEEIGYMLPVVVASNIHGDAVVEGIFSSNGALAFPEVQLLLIVISASYKGLEMRFMWGCRVTEMIVDNFARALFYLIKDARILNEVAALLGLYIETRSISGIHTFVHNLCFSGVLFKRYSVPSQVDFGASMHMLSQVVHDATSANMELFRILETSLNSLRHWTHKGLFYYHDNVHRGIVRLMEIIHYLLFPMLKIVEAHTPRDRVVAFEKVDERKNVFAGIPVERSTTGANFIVVKFLLSIIMLAKALSKSHVHLRTMNTLSESSILHYSQMVADCTWELPWSDLNSGEVSMQNDEQIILKCKFPDSNLEDKVLFEGRSIVVNVATLDGPFAKMSNYIWHPGEMPIYRRGN